jgi:hypothetical protein
MFKDLKKPVYGARGELYHKTSFHDAEEGLATKISASKLALERYT